MAGTGDRRVAGPLLVLGEEGLAGPPTRAMGSADVAHSESRGGLATKAARAAVAAVWLYEGLWCKVLAGAPDQRSIVATVPGLPAGWVTAALVGLGVLETAIALWVLSGAEARKAAYVQTGLLVVCNAGGLLFAGARIAEPGRMLTQNAVLLAVVWLLARQPMRRHTDG